MRVSEIRVKQIRVNQGLGVCWFAGLIDLGHLKLFFFIFVHLFFKK